MTTREIKFDPHYAHVLAFRHGPRAHLPPQGDGWDYDCPVDPDKAPGIAQRTRAAYFPDLKPHRLWASRIPRSRETLELLWPDLAHKIGLDNRLGPRREEVSQWAALDALPNAYGATPQELFAADPLLVKGSGYKLLVAAEDLACQGGTGRVSVLCSHCPIIDTAARIARWALDIRENGGWLPGTGFESGAFIHLSFNSGFQLAGCDYYPVPPA